MNPEQLREQKRRAKLVGQAQSEKLQEYLRAGGDPDTVVADLIPGREDQVRLERAIKALAVKAQAHPAGSKKRSRKLDQITPLVAELCVVERVLALEPLQRAGLRPSQLAEMAHTSPEEMRGKISELVAGVVGGGNAPRIEVAR